MGIRLYDEEEAEAAPDSMTEAEAAAAWRGVYEDAGDAEGGTSAEGNERREKAEDGGYAAVDDALLAAIRKSSWWEATDYREGAELSKAPRVWRADDRVPEMVRELVEEVIEDTEWKWADFESLTPQQARELEELLAEKLTQPQGWSLESIARELETALDLSEDAAVGVAADTTHSVLNETREAAYERMDGSEEFRYSWLNPQDSRTTPVCAETIAEIDDRGGSVRLPTLKQILRQKAQKYEGTSEGGGTPGRVSEWSPHFGCRSTFSRVLD
jgi:hypothetical protein